jgi:hypothetical protein
MRMRFVLVSLSLVLCPRLLFAQSADLPNADLPGNSPSLPNSNLPGSMPTANPITLPPSDTSKAVTPWNGLIFPEGSNVPERNPTQPISQEEWNQPLQQQLAESQAQTVAAQKEAQAAREDAASARDEAAAARDEAAAARQDIADLQRQIDESAAEGNAAPQKGAPGAGGAPAAPQPPAESQANDF